MGIIGTIDAMIERRSLLKHPFYEMWSDGKLTRESLAGYSKEYFHLVRAVPGLMSPILRDAPGHMHDELAANRQEECDHIVHWVRFAGALGVDADSLYGHEALPQTAQALGDLSILAEDYDCGVCAMYAFEKEIPIISQTKLDGLERFYGIDGDEATQYFRLHMEADVRHAASWRGMLEDSGAGTEKLVRAAEASISAQNLLLDGCYEAYC